MAESLRVSGFLQGFCRTSGFCRVPSRIKVPASRGNCRLRVLGFRV